MRIAQLCITLLLAAIPLGGSAAPLQSFVKMPEVQAFIRDMHAKHGFDQARMQRRFAAVKPIPAVLKAIQPPRDPGIRSWQAYRQRYVEPKRIALGLGFWQAHAGELAQAEARYGVPREIIVAIIGVETIYGRHRGRFNTFAALATLAFGYPPRAELFRGELEELLLLARDNDSNPLSYSGSYAGALGLPQFLPSSIRRYAVDGDGDGRIDLVDSAADAIASVANFLAVHGWQAGQPISAAAQVDAARLGDLLAEGIAPKRTPAQLEAWGVVSAGAADLPAALIDLVTPQQATEYRLGYRNFYALTRYNRSSFYAMAVNDLAEELRRDQQQRSGNLEPRSGEPPSPPPPGRGLGGG